MSLIVVVFGLWPMNKQCCLVLLLLSLKIALCFSFILSLVFIVVFFSLLHFFLFLFVALRLYMSFLSAIFSCFSPHVITTINIWPPLNCVFRCPTVCNWEAHSVYDLLSSPPWNQKGYPQLLETSRESKITVDKGTASVRWPQRIDTAATQKKIATGQLQLYLRVSAGLTLGWVLQPRSLSAAWS